MHYEKFPDGSIKCIEDEIPFEIPQGWEWCRLGVIFVHNTGKALNVSDTNGVELTYITTSNLYWDKFELDTLKKMYFTDSELEKCTVKKGDLLVCEGGDIGRAAIWTYNENIRIQNHIHRLRAFLTLSNRFYYYIFFLWKLIDKIGGQGIGLQSLSSKALHSLIVPLPPLQEQNNIAGKLDAIFAIVNNVEKNKYDIKGIIQQAKSHILDLAIRGKLVAQDPNDEPASVLLKRIRAEKEKLIKQGKIKRDKKESVIFKSDDNSYYEKVGKEVRCIDDEIPFEIPDGWTWTRISNICIINPRSTLPDEMKVSFVPMPLIQEGFESSHQTETRLWRQVKKGFTHFCENDIGIAKITPCFENRKSVIFRNLHNGFGAGTTELHILRVIHGTVVPEYVLWLAKTDDFINGGVRTFSSAVGQQRISKDYILDYLIPLPPYKEQYKICIQVNAAMNMIHHIEANLS